MKTYVVYMAAGNSRRFGLQKLLYSYLGKPLYRYTLDQLLQCQKDIEIIVVTQHQQIIEDMKQYSQVTLIHSPLSHLGLSYTIHSAIHYLKKKPQPFWIMFVVADQPYLSLSTIERMIDIAQQSQFFLVSGYSSKGAANPTLFHSRYMNELSALNGDQGGRVIMKKYPHCIEYVKIEDRECVDIDYQEDIQ